MNPEHLADAVRRALPPDFTIDPWRIDANRLVFSSTVRYSHHGKNWERPVSFDYIELRSHPFDLLEHVSRTIRKACDEIMPQETTHELA